MTATICSMRKEVDGRFIRAIVVAHEATHRDVHATPWCTTSERAAGWAKRYAAKHGMTVAYSDF